MDLAPVFFPTARLLRDPCYNVAPWNLTHRPVAGNLAQGLTLAGEPLRFFHFSGLDSGAFRIMLEQYGPTLAGLHELGAWYHEECEAMGQSRDGRRPWAYSAFADGTPVSPAQRRFWRDHPDLADRFADPFATGPGSFKDWYGTHVAAAA
jgi:hypothetical protein